MTDTNDAYWDDLGVAWTAINHPPQSIAPRMKWRLRRQTLFIALVLYGGIPFCLAGCALGVWTIWHGASIGVWNFVTRGIAIVVISMISGYGAWSFRDALRDGTNSLSAMVDLSLLRAKRLLRAIQLGYFSLGIAFIFGMAGYEIHVHFVNPHSDAAPPLGPAITTAILAIVLFLLQRRAQDHLAKYRYLKHLLRDEQETP